MQINILWPSTTRHVLFEVINYLAIFGPQITKRVNSAVFSVNPIAPPSSFTSLLFCSCAWSIGMDKKFRKVFATTKFPSRKAFSMHSATYSKHSCSYLLLLLVFVRGISFGVFFRALGSWIVVVLFKVPGFMSASWDGSLFNFFCFIWKSGTSLLSPLHRERCWKNDIAVPWNELVAVLKIGLWSMLSMAAVVKAPTFKLGVQATLSWLNWSITLLPNSVEILSTLP